MKIFLTITIKQQQQGTRARPWSSFFFLFIIIIVIVIIVLAKSLLNTAKKWTIKLQSTNILDIYPLYISIIYPVYIQYILTHTHSHNNPFIMHCFYQSIAMDIFVYLKQMAAKNRTERTHTPIRPHWHLFRSHFLTQYLNNEQNNDP